MKETAICISCSEEFIRNAGQKYPQRYCLKENCRRKFKLEHKFKAMAKRDATPVDHYKYVSSSCSKDLSDIKYHGKPNL